jgi:hypothetical protein
LSLALICSLRLYQSSGLPVLTGNIIRKHSLRTLIFTRSVYLMYFSTMGPSRDGFSMPSRKGFYLCTWCLKLSSTLRSLMDKKAVWCLMVCSCIT